jgi:hypothetical protein
MVSFHGESTYVMEVRKNIVMIVPLISLECDSFFEIYFSKIAICSVPRKETFIDFYAPLQKTAIIVYLL